MSHFAQIDENKIVTRVLVIEQDVIDTGLFGDSTTWVQTSYNTLGGKHSLGGIPIRKNYASVGYFYDKERDAFIPPKPYNSWILDEDTCFWNSPVAMPDDGSVYVWDETTQNWQQANIE
jgi:hypothetical protein